MPNGMQQSAGTKFLAEHVLICHVTSMVKCLSLLLCHCWGESSQTPVILEQPHTLPLLSGTLVRRHPWAPSTLSALHEFTESTMLWAPTESQGLGINPEQDRTCSCFPQAPRLRKMKVLYRHPSTVASMQQSHTPAAWRHLSQPLGTFTQHCGSFAPSGHQEYSQPNHDMSRKHLAVRWRLCWWWL